MISNLSIRQRFKHVPLITGLLFALPFSHMALSADVVKPAPKPVYKMPLNDTGIATCSNNSKNSLPCPVAGFSGQDAQYGRDKKYNKNADGHAGFSFTKISNTGKALPVSAKSWNCVKDNVTRLMWEVKTNDNGLHDMDWTYTWSNANIQPRNGGPDPAKCMTTTNCNITAYIKAVNKTSWCGYKDWRMATRTELMGLASLDRVEPTLDKKYFPETNIGVFWSSSPSVYNGGIYLWYVDLSDGYVFWSNPDYAFHVRLVRSGQ
ncbi:DUF1566 domain-containing protein [Crenothrix polyspora]|uniref:Lcl C-terminal domain-containing protein n=1 Tax=Crenothrix polyspora TaxID=360316 RepID=A0A1R4H7S9_9GAMM|nr:DUF1566 domain-containing protein [Crenothrix polyspora]SJM92259.1 conserved exported hypothetical protein [Crenothrix polyspora]